MTIRGQHGPLGGVEGFDAPYHEPGRAGALDARAHGGEQAGEVDDLRLAGRRLDHGASLGEGSGGHDVGRAEHRRAVGPPEEDRRAAKSLRRRDDVAPLEMDRGTERLQTPQMQIDGPLADRAAPGHGDAGPASSGEERPEHADAGPHRPDDVVAGMARDGVDDAEAQSARPFGIGIRELLGLDAEFAEQAPHVADVPQVGHLTEDHGLVGEQRGCHEGQGGVLRAADADPARERRPAVDDECVHVGVTPP